MAKRSKPELAVARSLDELARTLGYDAVVEIENVSSRKIVRKFPALYGSSYAALWGDPYLPIMRAAVLAIPEPLRGASLDVWLARAAELYTAATANATFARRYAAGLPDGIRTSRTRRHELLRFFDGETERSIFHAIHNPAPAAAKTAAAARPMREGNAELEAAIDEDPYDASRYAVYADWLLERGDRRGELIALQIAAEENKQLRDKVDALLERRVEQFLGPLAKHRLGHDTSPVPDTFTWRFGFIHLLRVMCSSGQDPHAPRDGVEPAQMIEEVLAHPSGRFVAELAVNYRTRSGDLQPVIDLVARRPASLRRLALGDGSSWRMSYAQVGDLSAAWPGLERLVELALHGRFGLGDMQLPHATKVTIRQHPAIDETAMRAIAAAHWPALDHLAIHCGTTATCDDAAVAAIAALPAVSALALEECTFANRVAAALVDAPLRTQLRWLSFANGQLSDTGARSLVEAGLALEYLDVAHCPLSSSAVQQLRTITKRLVMRSPR